MIIMIVIICKHPLFAKSPELVTAEVCYKIKSGFLLLKELIAYSNSFRVPARNGGRAITKLT